MSDTSIFSIFKELRTRSQSRDSRFTTPELQLPLTIITKLSDTIKHAYSSDPANSPTKTATDNEELTRTMSSLFITMTELQIDKLQHSPQAQALSFATALAYLPSVRQASEANPNSERTPSSQPNKTTSDPAQHNPSDHLDAQFCDANMDEMICQLTALTSRHLAYKHPQQNTETNPMLSPDRNLHKTQTNLIELYKKLQFLLPIDQREACEDRAAHSEGQEFIVKLQTFAGQACLLADELRLHLITESILTQSADDKVFLATMKSLTQQTTSITDPVERFLSLCYHALKHAEKLSHTFEQPIAGAQNQRPHQKNTKTYIEAIIFNKLKILAATMHNATPKLTQPPGESPSSTAQILSPYQSPKNKYLSTPAKVSQISPGILLTTPEPRSANNKPISSTPDSEEARTIIERLGKKTPTAHAGRHRMVFGDKTNSPQALTSTNNLYRKFDQASATSPNTAHTSDTARQPARL